MFCLCFFFEMFEYINILIDCLSFWFRFTLWFVKFRFFLDLVFSYFLSLDLLNFWLLNSLMLCFFNDICVSRLLFDVSFLFVEVSTFWHVVCCQCLCFRICYFLLLNTFWFVECEVLKFWVLETLWLFIRVTLCLLMFELFNLLLCFGCCWDSEFWMFVCVCCCYCDSLCLLCS